MSAYEEARKVRMAENARVMAELGLGKNVAAVQTVAEPTALKVTRSEKERRKQRRCEKLAAMRDGTALAELQEAWPGRESEVSKLVAVMSAPTSFVVVSGPGSTGKTAVTRAVIEARGEPFAWISSATLPRGVPPASVQAHLLSRAGRDLAAYCGSSEANQANTPNTQSSRRVDPATLAKICEDAAAAEGYDVEETPTFSVVIDDAGFLLSSPGSARVGWTGDDDIEEVVLAAFGFASSSSSSTMGGGRRVRLRLVFVGDDRALSTRLRGVHPLRVDFAAYDAAATARVLSAVAKRRNLIPKNKETSFAAFASQIVAVARRATNDPRDLVKLAASDRLFRLYDAAGGSGQGYAALKPILQRAVDDLHDPYLDVDALVEQTQRGQQRRHHPPGARALADDLPRHARFLLLAAFVATFSSKDTDKLLFTTGQGGHGKKKNHQSRKRKHGDEHNDASSSFKPRNKADSIDDAAKRAGPQAAPLDRILNIHAYIVANHLGDDIPVRSDAVLHTFAALVKNKLIDRTTPLDDLSQLKFKCLLVADDAFQLASTLRFPLDTYLPAARM